MADTIIYHHFVKETGSDSQVSSKQKRWRNHDLGADPRAQGFHQSVLPLPSRRGKAKQQSCRGHCLEETRVQAVPQEKFHDFFSSGHVLPAEHVNYNYNMVVYGHPVYGHEGDGMDLSGCYKSFGDWRFVSRP